MSGLASLALRKQIFGLFLFRKCLLATPRFSKPDKEGIPKAQSNQKHTKNHHETFKTTKKNVKDPPKRNIKNKK